MPDSPVKANCYLRKATLEDIDILYHWANDPETRRNSFDQHEISRKEHEAWFSGMMNDPNRIQYIFMDGDAAVGQIRFDIANDVAEISYSIAPNERGKGYGRQIIDLTKQMIREDYPSVTKLKGSVKPNNQASISCFENNGFTENHRTYEYDCYPS